MSKIKICGLSRQEDIQIANRVLPDYIGFVFAKSKRQVSRDRALELKSSLSPYVKAVGVFVNEPIQHIASLCDSHIIDLIQLHGDETEDYIRKLKKLAPNPIIKAIRVKDFRDIEEAKSLSCDYFLFDTYQENQYGGSGKTFDWSLLAGVWRPFFLAGGLHAGNVEKALKLCHPYCVDVSSGVETDGFKEEAKVKEIVDLVRRQDPSL